MAVDRYSGGTIKLDGKIVQDREAQYLIGLHTATSLPREEAKKILEQLGLIQPLRDMRRAKRLRGLAPGKEEAAPEIPRPRAPQPRVLSQPMLRGRRL